MQWQNKIRPFVLLKRQPHRLALLLTPLLTPLLTLLSALLLSAFSAVLMPKLSLAAVQQPPQLSRPGQTAKDSAQTALFGQAWQDLQLLASDEMAGRSSGSQGSVLAQQYLQQRFAALGLIAFADNYRQSFRYNLGFTEQQGVNLVGLKKGCRYPDIYIVVTAHYDHLKPHGKRIFNGADDNASGVAGLLYLAAMLQSQCPAYSYLFVATDAEEHGLDGAKAFLAEPPVSTTKMLLNINLDMISRGERGNRLYLLGKRSLPAIIQMPRTENNGVRLVLASERRPESRGSASVDWSNASDHGVFRRAGIPYLYFGVDIHADYHSPNDDWQRIDADFFQAALNQIAGTVSWIEQQNPAQFQFPRTSPD